MSKFSNDIPPFPHFTPVTGVAPTFFVNREDELQIASNTLVRDGGNILITGARGIGKSSFLFKIRHELCADSTIAVFPVWVDMHSFLHGELDDFLSQILERLCSDIWTTILKKDCSHLYEMVSKHRDDSLVKSNSEKTVIRIYRLVTSNHIRSIRRRISEAGATLIARATMSESTEVGHENDGIQGYQFIHLIEELKEILAKHGFRNILILCDEANRLSETINKDILLKYFEIFASKQVQFAFVAVPFKGSAISDLFPAFQSHIQLGPFPRPEFVDQLIQLVLDDLATRGGHPIPFDRKCGLRLFEICEGHPRYIQILCRDVYELATDKDAPKITTRMVDACGIELLRRINETERMSTS